MKSSFYIQINQEKQILLQLKFQLVIRPLAHNKLTVKLGAKRNWLSSNEMHLAPLI